MRSNIADHPAWSTALSGAKGVRREAPSKENRYRTEDFCRLGLVLSDSIAIVSACVLAYWVRFDVLGRLLPPESFFAPSGGRSSFSYWASILSGGTLLVMILFLNGAYQNRALLRFATHFS
jgi:hypothetical protein